MESPQAQQALQAAIFDRRVWLLKQTQYLPPVLVLVNSMTIVPQLYGPDCLF